MKYALLLIFLAACATTAPAAIDDVEIVPDDAAEANDMPEDVSDDMVETMDEGDSDEKEMDMNWQNIELKDVNSKETYTIAELDKPLFVESFAVWCPTCTKQQKVFKEYHELHPEIVTVALNTDPNEGEDTVQSHAQGNGFTWRYSVSPEELTTQLIEEFGLNVVNAPGVPVILLCPDDAARLLGVGVKDIDELDEALASCSA